MKRIFMTAAIIALLLSTMASCNKSARISPSSEASSSISSNSELTSSEVNSKENVSSNSEELTSSDVIESNASSTVSSEATVQPTTPPVSSKPTTQPTTPPVSSKPATQPTTPPVSSKPTTPVTTLSGNANLASITLQNKNLALEPAFSPNITEYTCHISYKYNAAGPVGCFLTCSTEDSNAKYTLKQPSTIVVGTNIFTIIVTAQNGTTKTYTITANQDGKPQCSYDNYTKVARPGCTFLVGPVIKTEDVFNTEFGMQLHYTYFETTDDYTVLQAVSSCEYDYNGKHFLKYSLNDATTW